MTAVRIMASEIRDSFHDNSRLFDLIDEFVFDTSNSMSDRADIIEWMETRVLGCESSRSLCPSDEDYVQSYVDDSNI